MNPSQYTGLFMELASHGFIVFAPFHVDGTCSYTEKSDRTPIFADGENKLQEKVDIRTKTMVDLYTEIAEMGTGLHHLLFGPHADAALDMSHLYMAGHGLGGNDAFLAAQ